MLLDESGGVQEKWILHSCFGEVLLVDLVAETEWLFINCVIDVKLLICGPTFVSGGEVATPWLHVPRCWSRC